MANFEWMEQFDVVVIGAGFAGIAMGYRLKQQGKRSFMILERGDRIGGTWRDNSYPGAACDVQSHLYSFSFAPNPNWSRMYSGHSEIWDYMDACVTKFDLQAHIRCNQSVEDATFNAETGSWTVSTTDGNRYMARVVVGCTGPLNKPSFPNIKGRELFQGASFHTAQWDHNYDHKGKRVAVVGTGASAIQVVPGIAADVQHLCLFQRTPAWVVPRRDRTIKPWEHKLFAKWPITQWLYREQIYWANEIRALAFVKYPGVLGIPEILAKRHIRKAIKDKELADALTPKYTLGCKRVLKSDDYYPAIARANVDLVTAGIQEITETGLITQDGKHYEVDAIVYATGFQASENMAPFEFNGLAGRKLKDMWQHGGEAYLGSAVSGFPNHFIIVGPNTGLGHNSVIHIIESQVAYAMGGINTLFSKGYRYMDVKQAKQDAFNADIQKKLAKTVWNTGGCTSWYLNDSGKNTTLWPGFTFGFRKLTAQFNQHDYELVS